MTNSDRLQEIRERAAAATPGPWEYSEPLALTSLDGHQPEPQITSPSGTVLREGADYDDYGHFPDRADWEFIAASREDIPYLLQLVTDQQKEIARVRRTVSTLVGGMCEHKNNCQYPNCNCGQTGDPGSAFGTPGIPD